VKTIPEAPNNDQEGEYLEFLERRQHLVSYIRSIGTGNLELLYDKLDMFTKLEILSFEFFDASSSRFMDCIETATQKNNLKTVKRFSILLENIDKLSIPANLDNIQPMHSVT
jgi:hypothetical protein